MHSALLVLALLVAPPPAACDASKLVSLDRALGRVLAVAHPAICAHSFHSACPAWPAGLREALDELTTTPREDYGPLDEWGLTSAPEAWAAVCEGGLALAARVADGPKDAQRAALYAGCRLERHQLATLDEFKAGAGPIYLPLVTWKLLEGSGLDAGARRNLYRAFAGLGRSRSAAGAP